MLIKLTTLKFRSMHNIIFCKKFFCKILTCTVLATTSGCHGNTRLGMCVLRKLPIDTAIGCRHGVDRHLEVVD